MTYKANPTVFVVALVAAMASVASAACNSLDISRHEANGSTRSWYIKMDVDPSFPVSDTLRCDDNTVGRNLFPEYNLPGNCDRDQCWLPSAHALYVRLNRTLNITVPDDVEEFIFSETVDTVARELDEANHTSSANSIPIGGIRRGYEEDFDWVDFNQTSVWPTQHSGVSSWCMDRGDAGYWSMYPIWVCVDATAVGCDGLDEDVVVEACGLPARWVDREHSGATILSSWNITDVDPGSMSEDLVKVENATFNDGESARNVPTWGSDATTLPNPNAIFWGFLVLMVSMMVR